MLNKREENDKVALSNADTFGDRLRRFIKAKFKTAHALALAIGKTEQILSPYLNNSKKPNSEFLSLPQSVGCDINWLLSGECKNYDIPETIGDRIVKFAKERYGSVSALCRAIGLSPQGLGDYISNKIKPGAGMQDKLRKAGADIEWIMTGNQCKCGLNKQWNGHNYSITGVGLPLCVKVGQATLNSEPLRQVSKQLCFNSDLEVLENFVSRFKTKTKAANSLDMSLSHLSAYLRGVRSIGATVREKLREFGYYQ